MTTRRAFFLVVFGSLALNATAIWWGLPSRYGFAVDELQPSVIRKGIETRFSGDWHEPAYPPFHYYVLAATYLPVTGLHLVEPNSIEGYTLFFALGRLVSLVMGVGILLVVRRVAESIFGSPSGVFAALIVAVAAPFVYYAKTANLDVPLTFWAMLSLWFFLRVVDRGELRDYLTFTLAAVVAMGTKDQAFAFYLLPLTSFLFLRFRREGSILRVVTDRRVRWSVLLGVLAFFLLHNVVFNYRGFVHHFEEILWARRQYSAFENSFSHQLGMLRQTAVHVLFSLGSPLTIACALGMVLSLSGFKRYPLAAWPLLFGASYYLFFIVPVLSTWLRYSLPLVAILALYGGKLVAEVVSRGLAAKALTASVFVYSFARAASVDVALLEDSRYAVEDWLRENVQEGQTIGYMGPEYYLPRLYEMGGLRLRPTESVLERERPDFLVINREFVSRFEPGTREGDLFSKLFQGRTSYALVYARGSGPSGTLLAFDGLLANLSKISPPIEVYQRAETRTGDEPR